MAFRVAAAQCKKICPERLNWPGRLAGTNLWRPPWNEFQKYVIVSRPLFNIISSQKWCQISVRIFCVLPGTKNLQCILNTEAKIFQEAMFFIISFTYLQLIYRSKISFTYLWDILKKIIIFVKEVCNFLQVSVQQESSIQGMGCIWMFYSARFWTQWIVSYGSFRDEKIHWRRWGWGSWRVSCCSYRSCKSYYR